ncbi:MAG: RES family NAD+ phosphorylase [Nevskiales bacterium]
MPFPFDRVRRFKDRLFRNYTAVHPSQDLFDDLAETGQDAAIAHAAEALGKPPARQPTGIHRPFEYTELFARHVPPGGFTRSRYCDGSFRVWYGSLELETSVHESLHHWLRDLSDDGVMTEARPVAADRKLYSVRCQAELIDLVGREAEYPDLQHPTDYGFCNRLGAKIQAAGHPGLLASSARVQGTNAVLFTPDVLDECRDMAYLQFRYDPVSSKGVAYRGRTLIAERPAVPA